MKTGCIVTAAVLALSTLVLQPSILHARDTVVTYQGRVTSNGTNFTGNGQFKAAIVTSTNNTATATATANLSSGFVTGYTVTFGGNGYTVAPAVIVVFPEDVRSGGDKLPNGDTILQVDTYPLTIYSAAAIQELNRKMDASGEKAENRLEKLEAENAALKARLGKLESLLNQELNGATK